MKQNIIMNKGILSTVIAALSCLSFAQASGYHVGTQSVSAQSTANSSVAEAADASTIFYNPAGISQLEGTHISANANLLAPDVTYQNAQAFYSDGTPITSGDGSTVESGSIASDPVVVPHLYGSHQIDDKWTMGLGIYMPFATATEYERDSLLRYNINKMGLQSVAITPTLSYKINNNHSVAVGVTGQYAKAELRQFADFSPIVRYNAYQSAQQAQQAAIQKGTQLQDVMAQMQKTTDPAQRAALNQTATALKQQLDAYTTQAQALAGVAQMSTGDGMDGHALVEGDDWGVGYTLGYLWDVNDDVRVGATYRSKVEHKLEGDANWRLEDDFFETPIGDMASTQMQRTIADGGTGVVKHEGASVELVTPESISLHGMMDINEQWRLFGDVTWTRHSRFNNIEINYENDKYVTNAKYNPSNTSCTDCQNRSDLSNKTIIRPNWQDTYRVSVGAAYQYSDDLQLRAGIAYDQAPVKSADYRLSTMPDNDRMWLSMGAKYDINDNSGLNVGYSYMHVKSADANMNGWCGSMAPDGDGSVNCVSSRTNGSADYKSHAHIVGIQYNYNF